jgi:hypothetical protein
MVKIIIVSNYDADSPEIAALTKLAKQIDPDSEREEYELPLYLTPFERVKKLLGGIGLRPLVFIGTYASNVVSAFNFQLTNYGNISGAGVRYAPGHRPNLGFLIYCNGRYLWGSFKDAADNYENYLLQLLFGKGEEILAQDAAKWLIGELPDELAHVYYENALTIFD